MDDTLRLIQHLYDDDDAEFAHLDDAEFAHRLARDEELRREYEELLETKEALDQRTSSSPDPDVVDTIVDRAAEAASSSPQSDASPSRRADRAARAPDRPQTRRLQGVGAVLALLLVAAVGWWQMDNVQTPPSATTSTTSAQQTEAVTDGEQEDASDAVPAWDDSDEVVRLHRRIEMVRDRSNEGTWDEMPQPVDQAGP